MPPAYATMFHPYPQSIWGPPMTLNGVRFSPGGSVNTSSNQVDQMAASACPNADDCNQSSTALVCKPDEAHQRAIWQRVQTSTQRMRLERYSVVPTTFAEYQAHMEGMAEVMTELHQERIANDAPIAFDADLVRHCGLTHVLNEDTLKQRLHMLSTITIWAPYWRATAKHAEAPWPSEQELKEEGDERYTSGFRRFLPIPRDPGNQLVSFKQKEYLRPFEMDQVRPVAKLYWWIPIPYDHESFEPAADEDGVYIDDMMESGRVAYRGEKASRGSEADMYRDAEWESQYFGNRRPIQASRFRDQYSSVQPRNAGSPFSLRPSAPEFNSSNRVTILQHSPIGSSSRPGHLALHAPRNEFRGGSPSTAGSLYPARVRADSIDPSSMQKIGSSLLDDEDKENDRMNALQWSWPSQSKPGAGHLSVARQRSQSESKVNNSNEPLEGGTSYRSGNPWRHVSYNRNSFSGFTAIREESEHGEPGDASVKSFSTGAYGAIGQPPTQLSLSSHSISPTSPDPRIETFVAPPEDELEYGYPSGFSQLRMLGLT